VSNDTLDAVAHGFPGTDPVVIFNGVSDHFYNTASRDNNLSRIAALTELPFEQLQHSKLLHTNGRLVRRKGVLWFIDNVLPELVQQDPSILYLVSGNGKDREVIEAAIADKGMGDYVKLLGRVSNELLYLLYNVADLFVMPNIPVAKDMEGFGLVALEAASCGALVVASNLEGIPDAIIDGKNGRLVQPGDVDAFVTTILHELQGRSLSRQAVRDYTITNCSWSQKAAEYEAAMQRLIS
jgi:phosphatidylinositol alpha-1,6-mannosyltransferase